MSKMRATKAAPSNLDEAAIQRSIASDPENPELTDEQIAEARPFREVFPDLAASIDQEKARLRSIR